MIKVLFKVVLEYKVHKSCVASLFLNNNYTLTNTLINTTTRTYLQDEIKQAHWFEITNL